MKLKVRTQLGEQAKAINLVNVGLQKTAQRRFICRLHDFRLIEWTKKQRFVSTRVLTDIYQRTQIGRIFYVGIVYLLGPPIREQTDRVRLR